MTEIRPTLLLVSLCSLAMFTTVVGCHEVDDRLESPRPAAARAPTSVSESPSDDEPDEQAEEDDDAPEQDKLELTWFKGVDNLPEAHPCHDSTLVVYAEDRTIVGDGDPFEYSVTTLGELRDELGDRWVHFGPRTARGVRWERDGREYVVATCSMGGTGYSGYNSDAYVETEGLDNKETADAEFIIGRVGEPNNIEFGTVHWIQRDEGGAWTTTFERDAWAWDDEGNDPEFTARARIIAASDSDGDREPEVVALTIDHSYDFESERLNKAICPEQDPRRRCYGFELEVIAREGAATLVDRVMLRLNGAHALTTEAERPDEMSDEVYETLRSQLDAHRDDAVAKARAVLREDEKLR